ncbi:MAG: hypothetical protein AB1345_10980 [Chloroflexota bacterium]
MDSPEEIYLAGYRAFNQGKFSEAISLATQCLELAEPDSYWHYGSLGLRCWAANFLEDDNTVKSDAKELLAENPGYEKNWFDGLAWLNLGLAARRIGKVEEAKLCFANASERYALHQIRNDQPAAWALVIMFFAAVTRAAASDQTDALEKLDEELANICSSDEELNHLREAVNLYLRQAYGEDVYLDAQQAAERGTSRTFLALLLL